MYIGIDPGGDGHNGYAIYDPSMKQLIEVGATSLWGLFEKIDTFCRENRAGGIILESPHTDLAVFRADEKGNFRQELRKAKDVGKVMAIAHEIERYIRAKYPDAGLVLMPPSKRMRVKSPAHSIKLYTMPTKATAKQFADETGYTGTTNEHGRDAAMLVWGMTEPKFNLMENLFPKK